MATEKSAPDDRHDDVVSEQQIVDPPDAPDLDGQVSGEGDD